MNFQQCFLLVPAGFIWGFRSKQTLIASFRKYLASKHQWGPFQHLQLDFLEGRQAGSNRRSKYSTHYFHLIQHLCTTDTAQGAALLFQSCHISYTRREIGAHSHSKKAMGLVLLKWHAKHFRPHESQPQQGIAELDYMFKCRQIWARALNPLLYITPVCSSAKKHWKPAGCILQCFAFGIVTHTVTNQHCTFLQIRFTGAL